MAFVKGQSGNPRGRPKGLVTQKKLRASIEQDLPSILAAMIESAKAGDVQAAKLLIDRTIPALRPADGCISLPAVDTLAGRGQAILDALAAGNLPPNVAATLMAALGTQAKLVEATELVARIEALEAKL